MLGTNRNPTLPSQAEASKQNVQTALSSAEDIQSNQADRKVTAVSIDIHDYPEASTPQKAATEATRKLAHSVSILKCSTPDTLEEVRVEKQSTTPKPSNPDIVEESRVVKAVNLKTVQFSTV